jgi:MFS family permease
MHKVAIRNKRLQFTHPSRYTPAMPKFSFDILGLRDFRFLMLTRMMGVMALQIQAVIVGWQIYSLTHDTFLLGLTGLAEAVPALTCALFAGHVVDISRPHRVYTVCLTVLVLNTFMLLVSTGGLFGAPVANILPFIFSGIFISGVARSFIMPSTFSLLPQIVPRAQIPAASATLTTTFQIGTIAGPAIAGIIYGGYGPRVAWVLPFILMLVAFVALRCISPDYRHYRSKEQREPAVKSIKAGWRFIFQNKVLLSVMALDMFAVLFGGAVAMLPAFADQVLHVGSEGLGALRAAPAIGAVATALLLSAIPMKRIRASHLLIVVTGFGLCMIGFGLSHVFWLAAGFLALSGVFDSVSMVIRGTLMQLLTPENMRGRVSAVNSMFIISSNEIGAFESGLAARALGLVPSIIMGGIGTLLVVALVAGLSPRLRRTVVETGHEHA